MPKPKPIWEVDGPKYKRLYEAELQNSKRLSTELSKWTTRNSGIDKALYCRLQKGLPTKRDGLYIGVYFFGPYPQLGLFMIEGTEKGKDPDVRLSSPQVRIKLSGFKCLAHRRLELEKEEGNAPNE